MGKFQGTQAENCTAEAMIHGWEALCKLWRAWSALEDDEGDSTLTTDRTVQQNLRAAFDFFEAALEKFSCYAVYDIVGHFYNPNLHELDPSYPELKTLQNLPGVAGSNTNDALCGATVAAVLRPGLEVSGILHARPRVWVSLPWTPSCSTPSIGASDSPSKQHAHRTHAAGEMTALNAAAPLLTADAAGAPMRSYDTLASAPETATSVVSYDSGMPSQAHDESTGFEDSDVCSTWTDCSPGSGYGQGMEVTSMQQQGTGNSLSNGSTSTGMPDGHPVALRHGGAPATAAACVRGPLQLLLALRAGQATADASKDELQLSVGAGRELAASPSSARGLGVRGARRCMWQDEPLGGRRDAKGAGVSDPAAGVASDAAEQLGSTDPAGRGSGHGRFAPAGGNDSGDDDVCYHQYDNLAHTYGSHALVQQPPSASQPPAPQPQPGQPQNMRSALGTGTACVAGGSGGGNSSGGTQASKSAVPVLLALERAATCAAGNGRGYAAGHAQVPSGPLAASAPVVAELTANAAHMNSAALVGCSNGRGFQSAGTCAGAESEGPGRAVVSGAVRGDHTNMATTNARCNNPGSHGGISRVSQGSSSGQAVSGAATAAARAAAAVFRAALADKAAATYGPDACANAPQLGQSAASQDFPRTAVAAAAVSLPASAEPVHSAAGAFPVANSGAATHSASARVAVGCPVKEVQESTSHLLRSVAGEVNERSNGAGASSRGAAPTPAATQGGKWPQPHQQPYRAQRDAQLRGGADTADAAAQLQQGPARPERRRGTAVVEEQEAQGRQRSAAAVSRAKSAPRLSRASATQSQERQQQPPPPPRRQQRPQLFNDNRVSFAETAETANGDGAKLRSGAEGPAVGPGGRTGRAQDREGEEVAEAVPQRPQRGSKVRHHGPSQPPPLEAVPRQPRRAQQAHQREHYERHAAPPGQEPQEQLPKQPSPQQAGTSVATKARAAVVTAKSLLSDEPLEPPCVGAAAPEEWSSYRRADEGWEGSGSVARPEGVRRGGRGGGGGRGWGGGSRRGGGRVGGSGSKLSTAT